MIKIKNKPVQQSAEAYKCLVEILGDIPADNTSNLASLTKFAQDKIAKANSAPLDNLIGALQQDLNLDLLKTHVDQFCALNAADKKKFAIRIADLAFARSYEKELTPIITLLDRGLMLKGASQPLDEINKALKAIEAKLSKSPIYFAERDSNDSPLAFKQVTSKVLLESKHLIYGVSPGYYSLPDKSTLKEQLYKLSDIARSIQLLKKIKELATSEGIDFSVVAPGKILPKALANLLKPIQLAGAKFGYFNLRDGITREELKKDIIGRDIIRGTVQTNHIAVSTDYRVLCDGFRARSEDETIDRIGSMLARYQRFEVKSERLLLSLCGGPAPDQITDTTSEFEQLSSPDDSDQAKVVALEVAKLCAVLSWLYQRSCLIKFVQYGRELRVISAKFEN
jgi:hypothetical protein